MSNLKTEMRKRTAKKNEKILTFKISLSEKPKITREIALAEGQMLYTLAEAIADSYDFYFDHCFGFYNKYGKGQKPERAFELFKDAGEECRPNVKGVKKTTIAELKQNISKKLITDTTFLMLQQISFGLLFPRL